jgi:deoxyribonuclease V
LDEWPTDAAALEQVQRTLAARAGVEPAWLPPPKSPLRVGAVFLATARGRAGLGATGDDGWAAAVSFEGHRLIDSQVLYGHLGAPYAAGLLALREGPLLEAVVRRLHQQPDVLLVNATGRDHPRAAGLALHLGAMLGLPSIGVTDRSLLAAASEPAPGRGASTELRLEGEIVGYRVRMQDGLRPIFVHAGWRVEPATARSVVLQVAGSRRTPEPLAAARQLARLSRAGLDA